jgi:hypothetical protein
VTGTPETRGKRAASTGTTPGRAACEAFWTAVGAGPDTHVPAAAWDWARSQNTTRAWEAAAKAGAATAGRELDEARAELAGAAELIRRLERITTAWTRGMYSARIDCLRGDPEAAAACLSEGLDGYEGPEWDGTETGAGWWERTRAEEGL